MAKFLATERTMEEEKEKRWLSKHWDMDARDGATD